MARGGERADVGHLRAARQPAACAVGQAEQLACTHASTVVSAAAAAGDIVCSPAFWSHAEVSQSAASAAGSAPPVTKPK